VSGGRPRLAIVGYVAIERMPAQAGAAPMTAPGGAAVYAALAAARLGAAPTLFAAIGDDWPRRWTEALERAGVDVSRMERRCGPTRRRRPGACATEGGEAPADRGHAWRRRTEALFPPAPTAGFDGYLACPVPARGLAMTVEAARGAFVCADSDAPAAGGAPAGPAGLAGVDLFAPEAAEAMLLAGLDDPDAAAEALRAFAPVVVLRRGPDGLERFAVEGRLRHVPPARMDVDPSGAGDAAVGALAASALLGEPPARQLERAAEAEALAAGSHGAFGLGLAV
jgi:sugar/nucleoside kinase (ribokinase family)